MSAEAAERYLQRAVERLGAGAEVTQQQTLTLALVYVLADMIDTIRTLRLSAK